jgi:hypothetical protein
MGYKITHIIIPDAGIRYELGYNNVYEMRESFKQVSNDCIKNTYVVKFKKEGRLGFAEISADTKGLLVFREYHSYIRKRKIKQHIRHYKK